MDRAEYQITFMTFFIGLGVADLFSSLVRMLKKRALIKWHWLSLVWTAIAFMGLIIAWIAYQTMFAQDFTAYGPGFLLAISPAIFIFAFTVSVLPHEIPEIGLNLKEYYFSNHKLVFSLAFFDSVSRSVTQYFILSAKEELMPLEAWTPFILLQLMLAGLIVTKNYYYHSIATILIFLFYLSMLLNSRLAI
jgi:hypothetical protein